MLRDIAAKVRGVMAADAAMREVNLDWSERTPALRLVLDQARLRLIGLTPKDAADQLQFLLSGAPITQVREDIRTVEVTARAIDAQRLDPTRLADFTLTTRDGRVVPVTQVGTLRVVEEDQILKRRESRTGDHRARRHRRASAARRCHPGSAAQAEADHRRPARRLSHRNRR